MSDMAMGCMNCGKRTEYRVKFSNKQGVIGEYGVCSKRCLIKIVSDKRLNINMLPDDEGVSQ